MTIPSVVLVAKDRLRGAFLEDLTGVNEAIGRGNILVVMIRAVISYNYRQALMLDSRYVDCCCRCLSADDKERLRAVERYPKPQDVPVPSVNARKVDQGESLLKVELSVRLLVMMMIIVVIVNNVA
jgi:hypothetical protein